MRSGRGCFVPRTLKILALLCIRWDKVARWTHRADDLAGGLWNDCNDNGHRLEGLMMGEVYYDTSVLESFMSDLCSDVELLRTPGRPQPRDANGEEDEEWLHDMYEWDPSWLI